MNMFELWNVYRENSVWEKLKRDVITIVHFYFQNRKQRLNEFTLCIHVCVNSSYNNQPWFTCNTELQITIFVHPLTLSLFIFPEVRPCQYEGVLKQPGESFHSNNCQKQCRCSLQGELLCQPTVCPSGLEKRGMLLYKRTCFTMYKEMLGGKIESSYV